MTTADIARQIIVAKILNSRTVILDAAKDRAQDATRLREIAADLSDDAASTAGVTDLDHLRGIEGNGARRYLAALGGLARPDTFRFTKRSRRPPTSRCLVHDLEKAIDTRRDSVGIYRLHAQPAGVTRRLGRTPDFDQSEPYVL